MSDDLAVEPDDREKKAGHRAKTLFDPNGFWSVGTAWTPNEKQVPALGADTGIDGALMSYFNDSSEQYRLAPFYIDRILKGAKPGELPVHLPTRFKFIVNRKTASALGIEVPLGLLLAADEVIE